MLGESEIMYPKYSICETDFNDVEFPQKFDKIISLGVFEHFGNMTKTLAKFASFLKPEGKVLIHIISTRLPNNIWSPFLQKYIFPYARIWRYDFIPNCNEHLRTINIWYLNGLNYAKTLKAWLRNFDNNQDVIKTLDFGLGWTILNLDGFGDCIFYGVLLILKQVRVIF